VAWQEAVRRREERFMTRIESTRLASGVGAVALSEERD